MRHDRLLDRIAKHSGLPVTSSVLGVVAAAKHLGLRRIAIANKWSEPMNRILGEFFARGGVEIAGVASEVLSPAEFQKISTADNMALAYELGRAAFTRFPEADGLYIGGGAWLSEPVCQALGAGIRQAGDLQPERDDLGQRSPGSTIGSRFRGRGGSCSRPSDAGHSWIVSLLVKSRD